MNRKSVFVAIVIAVLFAGATTFAQQQRRAYNLIMKDVSATFTDLRKNLEGIPPAAAPAGAAAPAAAAVPAPDNSAKLAAAAENAAKLEGFFAETEAFWAPFDTRDAVDFAKRGREAAAALGTAAKANDTKAVQTSVTAIQRTCAGCHAAHREATATGFLIKP